MAGLWEKGVPVVQTAFCVYPDCRNTWAGGPEQRCQDFRSITERCLWVVYVDDLRSAYGKATAPDDVRSQPGFWGGWRAVSVPIFGDD